jgi:hypothetical protein
VRIDEGIPRRTKRIVGPQPFLAAGFVVSCSNRNPFQDNCLRERDVTKKRREEA